MAAVSAAEPEPEPLSATSASPSARATPGDAVESLVDEHRLIGRLLDLLEIWTLEADRHEGVSRARFRDLVTVLVELVDQIHHEKEENVLMPALFAAGVDWAGEPLAAVRLEHDHERYLTDVLRHLAEQSGEWSEHGRLHFIAIARELVAFQRRHVRMESALLYPLVQSRLSTDRQLELAAALARFDARARPDRDRLLRIVGSLVSLAASDVAAGEVAIRPVFSVSPGMPAQDAAEFAAEHGVHHLPVVLSGELIGVVCTCDLEQGRPGSPISEVMHAPAVTIDALESCDAAARLMSDHRVGSVLVVRDDEVLGIVTRADLIGRGLDFGADLPGCRCSCCGATEHLRPSANGAVLCLDCRDHAGPLTWQDELGGGD